MAKWNPFEDHILNADPDEFSGSENAGYGVPRDASGGEGSELPQENPAAPNEENLPLPGTPAAEEDSFPESPVPEAGAGMDPGAEDAAPDLSPVPDTDGMTLEGSAAFGADGTAPEGSAAPDADGTAPEGSPVPGADGMAPDGFSASGTYGTAPDAPPAPDGGGFGPESGSGAGAFSGPESGLGHDFDDEEPKYDTQTGERLDQPKKKYPAVLLTIAVSALAIGAFVWSVKPGGLPSGSGLRDAESEETEVSLAIAAAQTEEQTQAVLSSGTEETESGVKAGAAEETESGTEEGITEETESGTEEEIAEETKPGTEEGIAEETKPGTEAGETEETEPDTEAEETEAAKIPVGESPKFLTDGVTVSASLDVSDMVEEVMPEVVSVTATSVAQVMDFFYGVQEIRQTEAGSGIIIDRDEENLYIVTDASLLSEAKDVTVGFSIRQDSSEGLQEEDTIAPAQLLGVDEDSLLAVLRVPLGEVDGTVLTLIKTADLGDSDQIRPGDSVFAIGNAMGRGLSVTRGIISAVQRTMKYGSSVHEFIQTDASINYGNYGGALLNEKGEVIGINAGKITEDYSEGIGFAFPVNDAKEAIARMMGEEASKDSSGTKASEDTIFLALAESETASEEDLAETEGPKETEEAQPKETEEAQLSEPSESLEALTESEADGEEESGQLGVQVGEFSKESQIVYRIPEGVVIAEVMEGSGAQAAGLMSADLITKINDEAVSSVSLLKEALSGLKKGDRVKVSYIRPDEDGAYSQSDEAYVMVVLS